jgi:hypothetical protein
MASFVHTCDRCGTRMQVHERYFGRTLKCTGCRTEFVAEAREEDLAAPPPEAAAPRAPARAAGGPKRLVWLLLLVPLIGLGLWLGRGEGPPETAFREQHAVGDVAALDTGTTRPVLVALDQESVAALVDMRTGAVQLGISGLMSNSERYLEVEAGTRASILAFANEDREAKVRLVEGPSADQEVWVPRRWLR